MIITRNPGRRQPSRIRMSSISVHTPLYRASPRGTIIAAVLGFPLDLIRRLDHETHCTASGAEARRERRRRIEGPARPSGLSAAAAVRLPLLDFGVPEGRAGGADGVRQLA